MDSVYWVQVRPIPLSSEEVMGYKRMDSLAVEERKKEEVTKNKLLEKIYSDKIDFYDGQKVMFGRETVDQEYAQVDSIMINPKGEENSVVYRLKRTDGKWKVYDAVVENISIVNNYRSQFDRVISKSSYEELKKMLREKAG